MVAGYHGNIKSSLNISHYGVATNNQVVVYHLHTHSVVRSIGASILPYVYLPLFLLEFFLPLFKPLSLNFRHFFEGKKYIVETLTKDLPNKDNFLVKDTIIGLFLH